MTALIDLLNDLNEEEVLKFVDTMLKTDSPNIILEELNSGMRKIGDRFERGELFLSEMLLAAEIFQSTMKKITPYLKTRGKIKSGKILLATIQGDVHTVGKNVITALLDAAGYTVIDIGEDVPPERIIEKVKEVKPAIVGISSLLTTGIEPLKRTIILLQKENLRNDVKILIGGAPITSSPELWLKTVKADDYGKDAIDTVKKVRQWIR